MVSGWCSEWYLDGGVVVELRGVSDRSCGWCLDVGQDGDGV